MEIKRIVSTSNADPIDISKNLAKSFSFLRDAPSAIFNIIDTAARFSYDVNPNMLTEAKADKLILEVQSIQRRTHGFINKLRS